MRVLTERLRDRDVDLPTGSRSSTSAAGRRCCPTRTSRSSTSTPRARPTEASAELEAELRALVEEIMRERDAPQPQPKSQAEVDPSGACCLNAALASHATKGVTWNRFPISARSSDDELKELIDELDAGGARGLVPSAASCTGRSTSSARSSSRGCSRPAGGACSSEVDVDRLTEILAGKAAPPDERQR